MIYAFDLIEHDGEDRRGRSFIDRSAISSSVVESSVSVLPIITMSTARIGTSRAA
jgi:ATP-dependent DNA ligase